MYVLLVFFKETGSRFFPRDNELMRLTETVFKLKISQVKSSCASDRIFTSPCSILLHPFYIKQRKICVRHNVLMMVVIMISKSDPEPSVQCQVSHWRAPSSLTSAQLSWREREVDRTDKRVITHLAYNHTSLPLVHHHNENISRFNTSRY